MVCCFWSDFRERKGHKMKLTKRQTQIFDLILKGKSNSEIEKELGIKNPTVKKHISKIFRAKKVKNRIELIIKEYSEVRALLDYAFGIRRG